MLPAQQPSVQLNHETVAELFAETSPSEVALDASEPSDIDLGICLVVFKCRRCNWDSNWMRRPSCDLTPPVCPQCSKGILACRQSSSQANPSLSHDTDSA